MINLQELKIVGLDFSKFPVGLGKCLGHFSPTLRSVSLDRPRSTRRQLLDFFRLFKMLDDIEIRRHWAVPPEYEEPDNQLVPAEGGLRGQLILHAFDDEGLLRDMAVTFGRMRFTSMDLRNNMRGIGFLLKTCARTLETLYLRPVPKDNPDRCEGVFDPWGTFLTLGSISKFTLKTSTCRPTPSFGL